MDPITLPGALLTLNDLMSLGGLVVAVYVIMTFLKEPLKLLAKGDWIVRPATVVVAFAILFWLLLVQNNLSLEAIGLALINAFLVAIVAGAAHDYIVAPTKAKAHEEKPIGVYVEPMIQDKELDVNNIAKKIATAIKAGDRGDEPPGS